MSKKNPTLNEMLNKPDWVKQDICPRCKQLVWYHKDGHDGSILTPQAHTCFDKRGL